MTQPALMFCICGHDNYTHAGFTKECTHGYEQHDEIKVCECDEFMKDPESIILR